MSDDSSTWPTPGFHVIEIDVAYPEVLAQVLEVLSGLYVDVDEHGEPVRSGELTEVDGLVTDDDMTFLDLAIRGDKADLLDIAAGVRTDDDIVDKHLIDVAKISRVRVL